MPKLKSVLLGTMPLLLMILTALGGWQLWKGGNVLLWSGLIISAMPGLIFMLWTIVLKRMSRSAYFAMMTVFISLTGTLITTECIISEGSFEDSSSILALALAVLAGLIHIAYFGWATKLDRVHSELIQKGKTLPGFELHDAYGTITSDAFLGKPTILIFYRGNWCPFCMAQIQEVAREYRELVNSGVNFALISPQPEKITQKLALRFNIPFMFLVDKGNKAIKTLGIEHLQGLPAGMTMQGYSEDTVFPTVIVTDENGIIVYCDQTTNFTIRPKPSEYLEPLMAS